MKAQIKTRSLWDEDLEVFPVGLALKLEGGLVVDLVFVPWSARGQGVGTRAMREFLAGLDTDGKACVLDAFAYEVDDPEREAASERLERWYGRLGFQKDAGSCLMYRLPAGKN